MTTINFNQAIQDAKSVSFEALPIGEYRIRIIESSATTSQSGKPMIKVKMEVTEGPYAPRKVFNQFTLTLENPNAVSIFFRHMKAFGLDEQFFAALGSQNSLDPVASAMMGREAYVKLGHREWQNEMRNNCEGFRPATGAPAVGVPGMPGMPGMAANSGVPAMPPPPMAPQVPQMPPVPAAAPPAQVYQPVVAQPAQPAVPAQPVQIYAPAPPAAPPVQPMQPAPVVPQQAPIDPAIAEMTNQAPPAPVYQAPAYAPPPPAAPTSAPQAPPAPPAVPVQQAPMAPPPPPQMPI